MEKKIRINSENSKMTKINVAEVKLKPEETSGALVCEEQDTFYYVLSGFGTLKVDVYGYDLEPQIGLYIPKGTPYTITNTSGTEMFLVQYSA